MARKSKTKSTRIITNEDVMKYEPMIKKYLRDNISKNWREASVNKCNDEITLGNTGMSMADMRQFLYTEVVVALQNFDPNHITPEGKTVKESTFVFQHLFNRVGQAMKRLTHKKSGYGTWSSNIEDVLHENGESKE